MTHECAPCAVCKARAATDERVDEVTERVLRAYEALEYRMTKGVSDDGAKVAARANALGVAVDIVRDSGNRY